MSEVLPPEEPGHAAESGTRHEVRHEIVELFKLVALFLVIFIGLKSFVLAGYEVQGPSMYPTLEDRERILVWKLPHELHKLPLFGWVQPFERSDIIVFNSTVEPNKRYVKRIVAMGPAAERDDTVAAGTVEPEDESHPVKVTYEEGRIFVDDTQINEPYLQDEERTSYEKREPIMLGPGQYYVLGDHRSVSKDSRSFGAIDDSQIIGEAVFRFWPPSRFGLIRDVR
ncbi:MAG: signal peptidase I [Candidatus Hydrogenedens sp.]|nr:signal peptidase I [Candidatus Hydrogenedens sp.]